jgi:hypothetical protein
VPFFKLFQARPALLEKRLPRGQHLLTAPVVKVAAAAAAFSNNSNNII